MLFPVVLYLLYLWIIVVIILFSQLPPRKALLIAAIGGFLFLPQTAFLGPANLQISKITMISMGCMFATLAFQPDRLFSFMPGLWDLPFLIWSFWVLPSQLGNGLSPLSPVANHILNWVIPYLMGRIYLNSLSGLRQMTIGVFVGGLAYAPFCLWESRMSPQLHMKIYGPWGDVLDFSQAIRLGGYRPTVFLGHGLPVGMWMAAATVAGLWLWQFKIVDKLFKQPIHLLAIGQLITFALVRSTGAYVYAVASIGILMLARWFRTALPLLLLILGVSGYLWQGATGEFYERPDVKATIAISYSPEAEEKINERAGSYWYRVRNEKVLSEHARKKLWTGWGGSGSNNTVDPNTGKLSVTDSLWILAYGVYGVPGLISFTLLFFLPALGFVMRYPARMWKHPQIAPASALPVILVIYMWDCTLNAFPNPVFLIISGGVAGMLCKPPERLNRPSSVPSSGGAVPSSPVRSQPAIKPSA